MRPSDSTVVGWGYGVPETALAVAALEAADIVVTAQTRQMMSVALQYGHALQGVSLSVPSSRAEEARAILAAMPYEEQRPTWRRRLLLIGLFFALGVVPPPRGLFLREERAVAVSPR